MRRRRLWLGLWLALALLSATACRQVLGLKHAHHEVVDAGETRQLRSLNGVPLNGASCEVRPMTECLDCRRNNCNGYDDTCASDHSCRADLDAFAICLGSGCKKSAETCSIDNLNDPHVRDCLVTCNAACRGTSFVSTCELYCACMQKCPDDENKLGGDCMATCSGWSDELARCQRAHCEMAQAPDSTPDEHLLHCKHATGALPVCERKASQSICTNGDESGWPCKKAYDCCARGCSDSVCD